MNPNEVAIRADERKKCAAVVREYARTAGEPRGVGPCTAAAEALEMGARMMRSGIYAEPAISAERSVSSTPAEEL